MKNQPAYPEQFPYHPEPALVDRPTQSDLDNLRLLSIFQLIYAGFAGLASMIPMLYLGMGAAFVSGAFNNSGSTPPPPAVGWIFIVLGATLMVLGLAMTACIILTGVSLANGRRHLFCLIVAFIECINFPFGTVLGVFTAITLLKPGVKAYFNAKKASHNESSAATHVVPHDRRSY